MPLPDSRVNTGEAVLLAAIVSVGAGLRLWAIGFGLPLLNVRPDEIVYVTKALGFGRGDLNPHYFLMPSLYMYLVFAAQGAYAAVQFVAGHYRSVLDVASAYSIDPSPFFVVGRMISAVAGTLTIPAVYALGKRVHSSQTGVVAAALLAVVPLHVRDSHFAVPDVTMLLFVTVALVFIVRMAQGGHVREYVLAGVFSGLAASTKYSALLLVLPIAAAHVKVEGWPVHGTWRSSLKRLVLAYASLVVVFVLTSPFTVLDLPAFWKDVVDQYQIVMNGTHLAADTAPVQSGVAVALRYGVGLWVVGAAACGLALAVISRQSSAIVALAFLVPYAAVAASSRLQMIRYTLPLMPFVCIYAAQGIVVVVADRVSWLVRRPGGRAIITAAFSMAFVGGPAVSAVRQNRLLDTPDTRQQAADWVERNVPAGATIALAGSWYTRPSLRRSIAQIEAELKAIDLLGAKRDQYQTLATTLPLLLDEYRRAGFTGGYQILTVEQARLVNADSYTRAFWIADTAPLDAFRRRHVEYVVASDFPALPQFNRPWAASVEVSIDLPLAEFEPFARGIQPMFDPYDAFYLPVGRFEGVRRPGPFVRVYRLGSARASQAATTSIVNDPEER